MLARTCCTHGDPNVARRTAVLLHGMFGDRRDFEQLRHALSSLMDCVSLDLPGHGDSAHLGVTSVAALDAVIATIEVATPNREVVLIGYSMGGRLAIQLAAARLQAQGWLISGLIILSGNPGMDDEAERRERLAHDARLAKRLRSMPPLTFAAWLRDEWYALPLWGRHLRAHPAFDEMLSRRCDGARAADRAAVLERESVGCQPSYWDWLTAPPLPVLFVAGGEDSTYTKVACELSRRRSEIRRDSLDPVGSGAAHPAHLQVAIVPHVGHALLTEDAQSTIDLCLTFLKQLPESAVPTAQPKAAEVVPPPPPPPPSQPRRTTMHTVRLTSHARLLPFRLPLTAPLPLARGPPLTQREGCLLLLSGCTEDGRSVCGIGELCPLPGFHTEGLEAATEQMREIAPWLAGRGLPLALAQLDGTLTSWLTALLPQTSTPLLPSVRCALEMAILHVLARATQATSIAQLYAYHRQAAWHSHVRINGLLGRGESSALEAAAEASAAAKPSVAFVASPEEWHEPDELPVAFVASPDEAQWHEPHELPVAFVASPEEWHEPHELPVAFGASPEPRPPPPRPPPPQPQSQPQPSSPSPPPRPPPPREWHAPSTAAVASPEGSASTAVVASPEGSASAARMRTWKVKVGGADPVDDAKRICRLLIGCTSLGLRLRLDANQAWNVAQAGVFCVHLRQQWLASRAADRAADREADWPPEALEFCEEPLGPSLEASLPGLQAAYGLRHALDESVLPVAVQLVSSPTRLQAPSQSASEEDHEVDARDDARRGGGALEALRSRLSHVSCAAIVLKPTILGGMEVSARLAAEASAAGKGVVLTSAFESGVALAHVAMLAAVVGGASTAHGLSTFERLQSDVLHPSFAAAVIGDLVDVSKLQAALDATADALHSRTDLEALDEGANARVVMLYV